MADKWTLESIKNALAKDIDGEEAQRLAKYMSEDFDLEDASKLADAIVRIRAGEPYAYVAGRADFYGYQFYVDDRVLIPRPETEELVYQVLSTLKKHYPNPASILDIGTGSACIPISIKKEQNRHKCVAIDKSLDALEVAQINAERLEAEVDFRAFDFLEDDIAELGQFDVIISNPPYIPIHEKELMTDSVLKHEPKMALFTSDEFGLTFYERIADTLYLLLLPGGHLYLEMNECHSQKIAECYQSKPFVQDVEIIKDLQGKERILHVTKIT